MAISKVFVVLCLHNFRHTLTINTLPAMYDIQLNESGTRHLKISAENLLTIKKYNLFSGLVDSTGYITEDVLDKLKLNIRSLIAHSSDNSKDLLDLCIDVVYHERMKAYGLKNLMALYEETGNSTRLHPNSPLTPH